MKRDRLLLFIFLGLGFVSACDQNVATTKIPTEPFIQEQASTSTPEGLQIKPEKFPSTYIDELAGIQVSYPQDWSLSPQQVIGERGAQVGLFSAGSTIDALVQGGSRIFFTTYQWDPKNDLNAYIRQRKTAWNASGFIILDESEWELTDGRKIVVLSVQTSDELQVLFALTTVGNDYLQISGEGDLAVCKEIILTLQPVLKR